MVHNPRFNVAITRAKRALVVFMNASSVQQLPVYQKFKNQQQMPHERLESLHRFVAFCDRDFPEGPSDEHAIFKPSDVANIPNLNFDWPRRTSPGAQF